jgi:hypothetical protein
MALPISSINSLSNAWGLLTLFLIPIGGGIPAGVLLARSRNLQWPAMIILYFISDVILAFLFEPLMLLIIAAGKRSSFFARLTEAFKKSMKKTTSLYGNKLGFFALIMVSFGVDPMTGRAAAVAAGHGFVTGWTLAIIGDMIYFTLMMASILYLNNLLGDGTWATVIILVVTTAVPFLIRRIREGRRTEKMKSEVA